MEMYQQVCGISDIRKNAFLVEQNCEEMNSTNSNIPYDFPENHEDIFRITGKSCPGGMTLSCSVYRNIRELEDLCNE